MNHSEIAQQALSNARNNESMANYAAIFHGFTSKGIPESEIKPRENVFTFHAWKALGRTVCKGEHGVKVCTYVPMTKKADDGTVSDIGRKPRMTTVFHISQTKLIDETAPEIKPEQRTAESKGFNIGGFINSNKRDITATDSYEVL